ncbi:hydroxymethylglutaryl-CoA lyase [Halocola ammonii]
MKLIECPRDAMQGIKEFIPTESKVRYINQLLDVGFHTIDVGSFVSPKAVPQMKDTAEVLDSINWQNSDSKLLTIVANKRGAEDAVQFEQVDYLGFPFSISEEFQKRNTNSTIEQSLSRVEEIQNLCEKYNKKVVIYISMAFGNPYGEKWDPEIAIKWSERLHREIGIDIIALSDTIGVSNKENISQIFEALIPELQNVEFGAHLHTTPDSWEEKVAAAYESGCRRFDGALKGFGGCPMAKDDLTGNMATENMISWFDKNDVELGLNKKALEKAMAEAGSVFPL